MGWINSAGIHDVKDYIIPFGLGHETVARGARNIIHNGEPLSGQAIEEGTLPNIGTADQSNNRFRHIYPNLYPR